MDQQNGGVADQCPPPPGRQVTAEQLYDGVLQRFVDPRDANDFIVRAIWTPTSCIFERRTSRSVLGAFLGSVLDGPEPQNPQPTLVPPTLVVVPTCALFLPGRRHRLCDDQRGLPDRIACPSPFGTLH